MTDTSAAPELPQSPQAPTPDKSADADNTKSPPISERTTYVFILVGIVLAFTGFFVQGSGPASARLMLVIGLGVLCGAMGATASIKFKTWSMGGGAAIGLILGWFLSTEVSGAFGKVNLIDPTGNLEVKLIGDGDFYGARQKRTYKFLVTPKELNGINHFIAEISDNNSGKEHFFSCIDVKLISIGGEKPLVLKFVPDDGSGAGALLLDQKNHQSVDSPEACKPGASLISDNNTLLTGNALFDSIKQSAIGLVRFTTSAWADPARNISKNIRLLESSSSFVRRKARSDLAQAGPPAIKPMLTALERPGSRYRTKLGVLVAVAEMMKTQPQLRKKISQQVSPSQLKFIIELAGEKDRTISDRAFQVLYAMRAPATSDTVATALGETIFARQDELLVLLGDSLEFAPVGSKGEVATKLQNLPQDKKQRSPQVLIQQIESASKNSSYEKKYSVVAGAYSEPGYAKKASSEINRKGLKSWVAKPAANDRLYRVIIGDYSVRAKAEKLRNAAKNAGVDGNLWLSDRPYER